MFNVRAFYQGNGPRQGGDIAVQYTLDQFVYGQIIFPKRFVFGITMVVRVFCGSQT
jgi:hypothetical protein